MTSIYHQIYKSPVAEIHLYASDEHLLALAYDSNHAALSKKLHLAQAKDELSLILDETARQLDEYFRGERKVFDLPLKFEGTDFQIKAWQSLLEIPYGETVSYFTQATKMENPKAVRAVGAANGKNAYSIIVPCHRVVGKDGSLTGYAGGKEVKSALLKLEGHSQLRS